MFRAECPKAFRRNYYIGSVGDVNCQVLDRYVAGQIDKHRVVDPQFQQRLESLQYHDPTVALELVRTSNHGRFIYNLHDVLESSDRTFDIRESTLRGMRNAIWARLWSKRRWAAKASGAAG